MKKLLLLGTLLLASLSLRGQQLASASPTNWLPLATAHLSSTSGSVGTYTALVVYVEYQSGPSNGTLLANTVWTAGNLGQQVFYDPSSPAFTSFVPRLTDGLGESVGYRNLLVPNGGGGGVYGPENHFLTTHPANWNGIDLQGYAITGIGFQMNQISFTTSAGFTTATWDGTMTFYTVPEPDVLSLLLLSGLGFWWWEGRRVPHMGRTRRACLKSE